MGDVRWTSELGQPRPELQGGRISKLSGETYCSLTRTGRDILTQEVHDIADRGSWTGSPWQMPRADIVEEHTWLCDEGSLESDSAPSQPAQRWKEWLPLDLQSRNIQLLHYSCAKASSYAKPSVIFACCSM